MEQMDTATRLALVSLVSAGGDAAVRTAVRSLSGHSEGAAAIKLIEEAQEAIRRMPIGGD
jgi:hypothetical protein